MILRNMKERLFEIAELYNIQVIYSNEIIESVEGCIQSNDISNDDVI